MTMDQSFKKGALVWYIQRDGTHREGKVVSVDITVQPPSYAVDLGESVRETEAHRLQLRQAGEAPPSVPTEHLLADAAVSPQHSALEQEEDDFGDFSDRTITAQPCVTPSVPHSFPNGVTPSASGFSQHQPHSNGFTHAPGAAKGLGSCAAPAHKGGIANGHAAAILEEDEEDFGDFADADGSFPGLSDAVPQGVGHANHAQPAEIGWARQYPASIETGPTAQLPDLAAIQSLHGSSQHARGPSVESAASLHSSKSPAYGAIEWGLPSGLSNGAKGEREYRVTPASTLSIAQQELDSGSDVDFGDFEDAQPDAAAEPSAKAILLDRNAPIPLSLFGEEEDESAPSEPVLDLAAPWGTFLQPGQPWASIMSNQETSAAPQSAVAHAEREPKGVQNTVPQQAAASAVHELADGVPDVTISAQHPKLAHHLGPAANMAAESSDSWVTAFTNTSQTVPGSWSLPGGPSASDGAAGSAQPSTADISFSDGNKPWLQLHDAVQAHLSSTSHFLQSTTPEGPIHITQHQPPGRLTAGSADAVGSHEASSAPATKGATSAEAGPGAQGQIRTPPHGIDWSAINFDLGAPGSPHAAAETAPQNTSLGPDDSHSHSITAAEAHANHSHGIPEEAPGSSNAVPEQAVEPESAAVHANEDDWDFGDFAGASAASPGPSTESAAVGPVPAIDLQDFQASSVDGAQPAIEQHGAQPEPFHSDWGELSLADGIQPAVSANEEGIGDGRSAVAVSADLDTGNGWGSWDASEAAAGSSAPAAAELAGAPSLAAGLPSPKLSAQLGPAGSCVLSFDQWGRAYSKLEQQAAKSGAGKDPAAAPTAAETSGAHASTFTLSEPSWGASQATAVDVWVSLTALNEAHAPGSAADSAAKLPPARDAHTAGSMLSHACADPFAAFDSMSEEVEPGPSTASMAYSAEEEILTLPMPAVDSSASNWSAAEGILTDQPSQQVAGPAQGVARHTSAAGNADSREPALQASKQSAGQPEPIASLPVQRSWGDGWADSVADSMALPSDQAMRPLATVSSWKCRQEEDTALEKALGCDRQTALLCLAQAASGMLVNGQQLWAEACLLVSPSTALSCSDVQQYLAALAHVRFVACAVDAALCCGTATAPSVEAELCRALVQCEEAWQQPPSGAASLDEALKELVRRGSSLAASARRAQEASQCLSQLQSNGRLEMFGAKCPLTGLPHVRCPDIPLVELHGRPTWAPVANLYLQQCPIPQGRRQH